MSQHNILYIAELIVSETLQRLYPENSLPPLLKVGITTGSINNRNNQLLSTKSPFMTRIVKAWEVTNAQKIESLLHSLLDNSRVEGEYFDDGKGSLTDAVSDFMNLLVSEANEIDVAASYDAKVIKSLASSDDAKQKQLESDLIPQFSAVGITGRFGKSNTDYYIDDLPGNYNNIYVTKSGYTLRVRNLPISEDGLTDQVGDFDTNIYQATSDLDGNCSVTFSRLTAEDVLTAIQVIRGLPDYKVAA